MNWITENPFPAVLLGIIVAALLVVALMKTGKRLFTWLIVGTAVCVGGIVVAEQWIVTPREEIDATLEEIRRLVESNQATALLDYLDPNANLLRNIVQTDLASRTVEEATITELKYENIQVSGDRAKVNLRGRIRFQDMPSALPLTFEIDLRKVDGRWLVAGAEYPRL